MLEEPAEPCPDAVALRPDRLERDGEGALDGLCKKSVRHGLLVNWVTYILC